MIKWVARKIRSGVNRFIRRAEKKARERNMTVDDFIRDCKLEIARAQRSRGKGGKGSSRR